MKRYQAYVSYRAIIDVEIHAETQSEAETLFDDEIDERLERAGNYDILDYEVEELE